MNAKKMITIFLCLCLVALPSNIFAENKTITLGGKTGWPKFQKSEGITSRQGRFGYECVELETNAHAAEEFTDLLLDFENGEIKSGSLDLTGQYKVEKNSLLHTSKATMGRGAALSRGRGNGLVLKGKRGTIFGSQGGCGSFSIEFWLCPATVENGETVFEWHSSRIILEYIQYQKIECNFINNRMAWTFANLFEGYQANSGEVQLQSYSMLIPNKWALHEISFDEETGLLEYRINGKVEAMKYITEGGREGRTVYQPVLGSVSEINICPSYTGCIDDFKISRRITDSSDPRTVNHERYKVDGGRFETKPIITTPASVMTSLSIVDNVPPQTEIRYYVRAGDNFFNWSDTYPKWIQVKSDEDIFDVQGRYFQIAADLFPDGGGNITPSVTEIKINYLETPLPAAPLKLKAKAGDSSVSLSWNYSVDENAGGYYIYYGNRPGEYLGTDAEQGPSPIQVDNITSFTLTGLKNGAIYYFAISTYSSIDSHISGNLSNETYARPGRR